MKTVLPTLPLIAHWPLNGGANDAIAGNHGCARNVEWGAGPGGLAGGAALFNGRDSVIEVADAPVLQLGGADFTLSAWIRCRTPMRGVYGDVLSKFDAANRCGVNLWISGGSSAYSAISDSRHLHVGIDDGYLGAWKDCGNPGSGSPMVCSMAVHGGELYAGIADASSDEQACRVFRRGRGDPWIDCGRLGGNPDARSVMSMLVHEGHLYAGAGIWDWWAAELGRRETPPRCMTRVYRYEGGTAWRDLGQVGTGQRVLCLASFEGALYAGLDRGGEGRCFKYQDERWVDCGVLDERDNFESLMPVGGTLYGASHAAIYRYDGGRAWTCIGRKPFALEQIHSLNVLDGKLVAGTWPQGWVIRHEGGTDWTNMGQVGLAVGKPGVARINEVNSLGVHNGKLYAGVLPKAQVCRYETDGHWTLLDNLASRRDWNPGDVPSWMRVLALATHKGMLFACTGACQARAGDLDPDRTAGRVMCTRAGIVASHEHDLGGQWTHLAAVRRAKELRLYVNGILAARSIAPARRYFDLGNAEPLRIGRGEQGSFDGAISDVRLYAGALAFRAGGQGR